jgi:hypothetical protein
MVSAIHNSYKLILLLLLLLFIVPGCSPCRVRSAVLPLQRGLLRARRCIRPGGLQRVCACGALLAGGRAAVPQPPLPPVG